MQNYFYTDQVIKEEVINILKLKEEWKQNQITINIQKTKYFNVQIYLIKLNRISSTMILSQNWPKQYFQFKQSSPLQSLIFCFQADVQTDGRGQRQNKWSSPEGNLYLTILIKTSLNYFPFLSIFSATTLYKVIQSFLKKAQVNVLIKIKWINDIFIDFQKVSGILIKSDVIGNNLFSQIGVGINIKNIPEDQFFSKQPITCLEKHTLKQIKINQISLQLIKNFAQKLLIQNIEQIKFQQHKFYQQNLAYKGRQVIIWDHKFEKNLASGKFQGINQYGHAILQGFQKHFIQGRMKIEQIIL